MKKRLIIISTIIIFIIIAISIGMYWRSLTIFTPERWDKEIYKREWMLDDLENKYNLIGMTYEELIELLGTNGLANGHKGLYYIGKSYVGPKLLSIVFDENDTVKSYGVIID